MTPADRAGSDRSQAGGATSHAKAWYRRSHARTLPLLLVLVTVVLTSLALEAATRFIYRDITTTGDNRSYFAHKWIERNPPSINRQGFRERDFSASPPQHGYRIAVIGDSFTYGQGIPENDRLTNLLESFLELSESQIDFEVLNFGKPGTDTVEHVSFLADHVMRVQPDFVLLQWFVNDARNDRNMRYEPLPLVPWSRLHNFLFARSALFYLINHGWVQLQYQFGLMGTFEDFMIRHLGDSSSWPARRAQRLLARFIEICRNEDLPMGMILFPELEREQPLSFLLDRVLKQCVDEGIRCVDLRDRLASAGDPSNLWVNQFDHHPNRRANEIAARSVLDAFGPEWMARASTRLPTID